MTTQDIFAALANTTELDGVELAELHDALLDAGHEYAAESFAELFGNRDGWENARKAEIKVGWIFEVAQGDGRQYAHDPLFDEEDYFHSSPRQVGFHGDDAPPTDAEYIGQDNSTFLVLHDNSDTPECRYGWEAERRKVSVGDWESDGVFTFFVAAILADGRQVLVCKC